MKFFRAKVRLWPLIVVPVVLIAAVVAAGITGILKPLSIAALFGGGGTSAQSSEVIKYVLPQQEVALASLRIEGLERADSKGELLGIPISAGDRTKYIVYSFDAKLGIDGSKVRIDATEDHRYAVSIPAFIFIGHSNEHFEDAIDSNGMLSVLAAEISETDMVNNILSDKAKDKYVANSLQTLKDQSEAFYGAIIRSVDAGAEVTFTYID